MRSLPLGEGHDDARERAVMSKLVSKQAWAVVNRKNGLLVVDGRLPLFWLRKVAVAFAEKHGMQDFRVRRVVVSGR